MRFEKYKNLAESRNYDRLFRHGEGEFITIRDGAGAEIRISYLPQAMNMHFTTKVGSFVAFEAFGGDVFQGKTPFQDAFFPEGLRGGCYTFLIFFRQRREDIQAEPFRDFLERGPANGPWGREVLSHRSSPAADDGDVLKIFEKILKPADTESVWLPVGFSQFVDIPSVPAACHDLTALLPPARGGGVYSILIDLRNRLAERLGRTSALARGRNPAIVAPYSKFGFEPYLKDGFPYTLGELANFGREKLEELARDWIAISKKSLETLRKVVFETQLYPSESATSEFTPYGSHLGAYPADTQHYRDFSRSIGGSVSALKEKERMLLVLTRVLEANGELPKERGNFQYVIHPDIKTLNRTRGLNLLRRATFNFTARPSPVQPSAAPAPQPVLQLRS